MNKKIDEKISLNNCKIKNESKIVNKKIIRTSCSKCSIFNIYSDNDYIKSIGYVCLICRLYEFPL